MMFESSEPTEDMEVVELNQAGVDLTPLQNPSVATQGLSFSGQMMEPRDPIKHRTLVLTLQRYFACFKARPCLEGFTIPSASELDQMSDRELENLLTEVKMSISAVNQTQFATGAFFGSLQAMEGLTCAFTPLRVEGLSASLRSDPSIEDLVNEFALEHMNLTWSKPEHRLLYRVGVAALAQHQMNKQKDFLGDFLARETDPQLVQKYIQL